MFKLTLGKSKYRIRILYKSGQDQFVWASAFNCVFSESTLEKVHYTTASSHCMPLFLCVENIEAVWQVDYRRSVWSYFS